MLDKFSRKWYNKGTKEMEVKKMEKIMRICEITGRVSIVAENLDTATAMEMVKELSKKDDLAIYRRVVAK